MDKFQKVANEIIEKIEKAEDILIISSRPADQDSIGSNLALRWFIDQKFENKAESVIFSDPLSSDRLNDFPDLEKIKYHDAQEFNFSKYNLILMVDGAKWDMFLGNYWNEVLDGISKDLVYIIDHHKSQGFEDISNQVLQHDEACTAKLIFDYFIKPSKLELDGTVATWLYFALVDDTGRFLHEIKDDTFDFASQLFQAGADHIAATDENMSIEEMKMMGWCIDNTDFDEEIKTTILTIDEQKNDELDEVFGSNWKYKKLYRAGYVEKIQRKISGFDYGVIFTYRPKDNSIHAGWRTRTHGGTISIQEVLTEIGFEAGGHFGAGGGINRTNTMEQIITEFKVEMSKKLKI